MNSDTVPFNDLSRLYRYRKEQYDAVILESARSGYWLNGPKAKSFCAEFSEYVGARHCVGCGNGTDALTLAIQALLVRAVENKREAKEVITVANAGGYTSTAAFSAGCIPVYVDVDTRSGLMHFPSALAAVSEQTLAIVVTHLYGGLVDVPRLRAQLDDQGFQSVAIIEDCAQAHGLSAEKAGAETRVGSLGDIGTFSFYPTKNLGAFGDGGALTTNHSRTFEIIDRLRQYGWGEKYNVAIPGGQNSRLDEIQAAVLSAQLPILDEMNARRVSILDDYIAAGTHVTPIKSELGTVAHLAVFRTENRSDFQAHMMAHGVATDIHFPILDSDQPGWRDRTSKIGPGGLSHSSELANSIVSLPSFPFMTNHEVQRVCEALHAY